jgi:hypothetical protein
MCRILQVRTTVTWKNILIIKVPNIITGNNKNNAGSSYICGLKQGDTLLPLLFNFALEYARVQANQEGFI